MNSPLHAIARQFTGDTVLDVSPLGNGLINDTFRVTSSSGAFVLQRINERVFPQPELVMFNLQQLDRHLRQKPASDVNLQIPEVLLSHDRQAYFRDRQGLFWRALELIDPAESREQITGSEEAEQVGFALAHFHRLCSDLPVNQLHDTLPGFHIAPAYFAQYQSISQKPSQTKDGEDAQYCRQFIERFRNNIDVLERAKQRGLLVERVTHGDPKLNNFLFRPHDNHIISLIDLDTVKPGLVHYDIGDCLRSCCHIAGNNRFDLGRCEIILASYLKEAGHFFTGADYAHLGAAIALIPFELGLRFFSDYLAGNCYFRVSFPEENLRRALAQFQLCEDIAIQQASLEKMILGMRSN